MSLLSHLEFLFLGVSEVRIRHLGRELLLVQPLHVVLLELSLAPRHTGHIDLEKR